MKKILFAIFIIILFGMNAFDPKEGFKMDLQLIIIGFISVLTAITLIIMKFRKIAPGRIFQLWLAWIALAYIATLSYPINLIGLGLIFIVPFFNYSKISYPAKLIFEKVELSELNTFPKWNDLSSFLKLNEFQHIITIKYQIMDGAEMLVLSFSNKSGFFVTLSKQTYLNKDAYSVYFKTFFNDGSSISTTNNMSNQDLTFKTKHPLYQVHSSAYNDLFRIHKINVENQSKGKYIEADEKRYISEFIQTLYNDIVANTVTLGYWVIKNDRCKMTFKGKMRALLSFFNFIPLFKKIRVV